MPKAPSQFMIINDNSFVNALLTSTNSYNELRLDVANAESTNSGELSLFCTGFNLGALTSDPTSYEFRVQNSGSLDSATWIWSKSPSSAASSWYGEPDLRYPNVVDNANVKTIAYGATGVYSSKENAILLYYGSSTSNSINVR